jgi:hypothetical protein
MPRPCDSPNFHPAEIHEDARKQEERIDPLFDCPANGDLMVIAAHRYCLGRSSYIVGSCCEFLRTRWNQIEPNTRATILRDTLDAIDRKETGMDMDDRQWRHLCVWAVPQLDREKLDWLKGSVRNRLGFLEEILSKA